MRLGCIPAGRPAPRAQFHDWNPTPSALPRGFRVKPTANVAPPSSPPPPSRPALALAAGALAVAALIAYANSFSGPLVFDDLPAIRDNPTIRELATGLFPPSGSGSPVSGRPVPNFLFALNFAAGGLAVRGYHAVNFAIHLLAALTLFGVVRRTLAGPTLRARFGAVAAPAAWFTALLWLVHPLGTAAVTYIVQRTESTMALCWLATLYAFIRSTEENASALWRVGAVAACALGMACKEVMVAAPLIVALYDRTFVSASWREVWQRRGALHLSLAATWALLGVLVLSTGGRGGTAGFATDVSVASYTATQFVAVTRYGALAFWPQPLVFDYGTGVITDARVVVPCAILVVALVAATLLALRRWPAGGFLGVMFFAVLAPSSSIVPVATQTMAEHRMYLPLAAIVLLAVLAAFRWLGRGAYIALGAAALLLLGLTIQRNTDYRSEEYLWRDTVTKRPQNARAHCSVADALVLADQADAALPFYAEALRLRPDYAEAQLNLGSALITLGRASEAIPPLEAALRLKPAAAPAHHSLANALARSGRAADAFPHYAEAARLKPDDVTNLCDWGNALQRAGRTDDAIARYEDAIRREQKFAMAHNNLANALAASGRLPEAIHHYETALGLEPNYAEGHNNFATALAQSGRFPEAIAQFEAALRLRPDYPSAHENLGKVYLALGDNAAAQREFALARSGAPARRP